MMPFGIESWIWYGIVIYMVGVRFIARILHFKSVWRLQIEDWLMLFLTCLYTILVIFLNIDHNISTNLIDPAHPVVLTPQEIKDRTWASKTILLVEQCMCATIWGCKACLLILYWRLTQNLVQNIVVKCATAYVAITYVVMEILYFGVWCRPFHDYWKTPTDNIQCTTALNHLITNFTFNLTSDVIIMSIPLPLLIKAHLPARKKILLIFPFSLGLLTIVCAILSKNLSFTQPFSADWVYWYCREASTAMIVTNMPFCWSLLRRVFHLKSFFGDSDSDRQGSTEVQSIQGVSAPGSRQRSSSVAMLQQLNHAESQPRRMSLFWPTSEQKRLDEEGIGVWRTAPSKDVNMEIAALSSSSSSASSSAKPSTITTMEHAIDKLYRLDDYDLEAFEPLPKRYNGSSGKMPD